MSNIRGRFQKDADKLVQRYTASIPFDQRLYQYDIAGSLAHAKMLAKQGIITDKDAELIGMGLVSIREEIEKGQFQFKAELEDIHMNIEAELTRRIGDAGAKLHTARSRNDQVATDLRLYAKEQLIATAAEILALARALAGAEPAGEGVAARRGFSRPIHARRPGLSFRLWLRRRLEGWFAEA